MNVVAGLPFFRLLRLVGPLVLDRPQTSAEDQRIQTPRKQGSPATAQRSSAKGVHQPQQRTSAFRPRENKAVQRLSWQRRVPSNSTEDRQGVSDPARTRQNCDHLGKKGSYQTPQRWSVKGSHQPQQRTRPTAKTKQSSEKRPTNLHRGAASRGPTNLSRRPTYSDPAKTRQSSDGLRCQTPQRRDEETNP